jgi:hypothetical protein
MRLKRRKRCQEGVHIPKVISICFVFFLVIGILVDISEGEKTTTSAPKTTTRGHSIREETTQSSSSSSGLNQMVQMIPDPGTLEDQDIKG